MSVFITVASDLLVRQSQRVYGSKKFAFKDFIAVCHGVQLTMAALLSRVIEDGVTMQASALRTQTESSLRSNNPFERYTQAVADARANTQGKQSASKVLNEGMLLEVLGPKANLSAPTFQREHTPFPDLVILSRKGAGIGGKG